MMEVLATQLQMISMCSATMAIPLATTVIGLPTLMFNHLLNCTIMGLILVTLMPTLRFSFPHITTQLIKLSMNMTRVEVTAVGALTMFATEDIITV